MFKKTLLLVLALFLLLSGCARNEEEEKGKEEGGSEGGNTVRLIIYYDMENHEEDMKAVLEEYGLTPMYRYEQISAIAVRGNKKMFNYELMQLKNALSAYEFITEVKEDRKNELH